MSLVSISKDADNERPIPSVWRKGLKRLADGFLSMELIETNDNISISSIASETKEINFANITDYPDRLGPLAEKAWETSVCIWASDHWDILVDLSDENGETTDLVLHATIYEEGQEFILESGLIYVP
jgi:hypothetical protein